jgi:hypothetical protein
MHGSFPACSIQLPEGSEVETLDFWNLEAWDRVLSGTEFKYVSHIRTKPEYITDNCWTVIIIPVYAHLLGRMHKPPPSRRRHPSCLSTLNVTIRRKPYAWFIRSNWTRESVRSMKRQHHPGRSASATRRREHRRSKPSKTSENT